MLCRALPSLVFENFVLFNFLEELRYNLDPWSSIQLE